MGQNEIKDKEIKENIFLSIKTRLDMSHKAANFSVFSTRVCSVTEQSGSQDNLIHTHTDRAQCHMTLNKTGRGPE